MSTNLAAPPPEAATRPQHPARTPLLVAGCVVAALGIVWSALNLVTVMGRHSARSSETVAGSITAVRVDPSGWCSGSLTLVGEDRADAALDWKDSWSLKRPGHSVQLQGSTLVIRTSCPASVGWSPNVNLTLQLPRAAAVDAKSDGRMRISGFRSGVTARSDSGGLQVSDVQGDLVLHSDSGSVQVSDVAAKRATVTSDSGSVRLDLAAVPDSVSVRSDSGSVRVWVPGSVSYAVDGKADSGDVTVDVVRDPNSRHTVTARADSGDITVSPR